MTSARDLCIESHGGTAGATFAERGTLEAHVAERGAVEAVITERGALRTGRAAVVR